MADQNQFGPIEYIVVEFPGGKVDSEGFDQVLALVDAGVIRILDLEFVVKHPDGTAAAIDVSELHTEEFDTAVFAGASSALLDAADLAVVGENIDAGSLAAVLVYEELALLPVIEAWTRQGGRIITEGHLELDELAAVLADTAHGQEIQL